MDDGMLIYILAPNLNHGAEEKKSGFHRVSRGYKGL